MPHQEDGLSILLVVMAVALIVVPVFERLRVTPVAGYLAAGTILGPSVMNVIADPKEAMTFTEYGVVFLMFSIGLELSLRRLAVLRREVFGLGTLQVVLTAAALFAVFHDLAGVPLREALVLAGALSLSSTAVVMKLLRDEGDGTSRRSRVAFSVLLLQDLAVVPLLVLLPVLAGSGTGLAEALLLAMGKAVLMLLAVVAVGRFAVEPAMRVVAASRARELFTFAVLLLVLGVGSLTQAGGLSFALGALLAGLLLSGTDLRHRVEATVEPIRSVMLALFFVTVGSMIDVDLIRREALNLILFLLTVMTLKAVFLTLLCLLFRQSLTTALWVGAALSQAGEFAFIVVKLG
ncbi:cation:proton antiporter domain-containing protein [Methylobacterium iners]|uniref:Glutathione-regulated potassium-efflux system protein KefC n=1 Tax=Methylobacterium iners TaxID=418707 RepID=A0ABQ4RVP9_9HYPH|nr:cation:proton antiporter [Methylobacterium iners]GJD93600.1 Glutathione-regulated potassium-efflux system protein KefC [Methylobacterium iners]